MYLFFEVLKYKEFLNDGRVLVLKNVNYKESMILFLPSFVSTHNKI